MKWLHRMLILVGGGGFVLLLARSDLASLWRDAAALGAGAALIVAVALLEHLLHALAWRRCFAPEHRPGVFSLLGAYLAGGAVNLVTPTATLGGEVVRGGLLPRSVPARVWVATGTADRLAMAAADTAIGLAGFAVLVARGPLGGWARAALGAAALLLGAGVAGFLVLQRRGRLATLFGEHGLVRRLAGAQLGERLASASREVDRSLAALHAERPGDFRAAFGLHLAGASVGALQLAIFLSWLGVPYDLATLGSVFAVGMALDLLSFFVPARLGAQEAARMLAMSAGGLDPARGLLFSLVLRLEQILWAGAGFLAVPFLLRARREAPPLASVPPAVDPSRASGTGAELPGRTGMWSRRGVFHRILASPAAREFLLNSLAVGEADSALDLDRVAEHISDPLLARRIYRHFAEEQRHARLLRQHLESQGFRCSPLPPELDYERYAQRYGMGTPKARLDDPTPFSDADLILFFCGSKAGEERACAEMEGLIRDLAGDPETAAVLRTIHGDEQRHVSYATLELQRLAEGGQRPLVLRQLRAARRAEARAHRAVSRAFMKRLLGLLGIGPPIQLFAGLAIDAGFLVRWLLPGGLDGPRLENPMPVPGEGVEA